MLKKLILSGMAAAMLVCVSGCSEAASNPKYEITDRKSAVKEETTVESPVTEAPESEKKKETKKTEKVEKPEVIINQSPYQYEADIKDEGVQVMKNSDGSIRITFLEGKFALNIPEALEDHFVLKDGHISSKKYYESHDGGYSKMACISFSEGFEPYFSDTASLLGKSGDSYMYASHSKDADYKPSGSEAENEEFNLIEQYLKEIYASAESCSIKTGKWGKILDISEDNTFRGEVISDGTTGFTDDDIRYGGDIVGRTSEFPVEEGWGIVGKKAVRLYDGTYFDCYNSSDGTHYGWLCETNIHFFFEDENK